MKTYSEFKKAQYNEINEFHGMFFAFSKIQFAEGMEKIGLSLDDKSKICSVGGGGFMLKEKFTEFILLLERHKKELKEMKKNEKLLTEALVCELINHEYCRTYNPEPALSAIGITKEEIDPKILKNAISQVMQNFEC